MYLLNASTYTLHYFSEPNVRDYAILSHRWDAIEVSFTDIRNNKDVQKAVAFSKVRGCCAQARRDGFEYVWIDSCCIDKSSSSELSEAINSMYSWYANAQVCYAYLSDVNAGDYLNGFGRRCAMLDEKSLRDSKWFTRGWSLQELLAPQIVIFYSREWQEIGTKRSLQHVLSSITGIKSSHLAGMSTVSSASIAEKMSWASRRVTSRVEDMAYCLLGLFGVNIPPLYGEGRNAFIRLQLEILRTVNDESMFAWTIDKGEDLSFQGGLLAHSPAAFKYSGDVRCALFDGHRPPYQMTNKGLHVQLILTRPEDDVEDYMETDAFLLVLNCCRNDSNDFLAILLRKVQQEEFIRIQPEALPPWDRSMGHHLDRQGIYVRQPGLLKQRKRSDRCYLSVTFDPDHLKMVMDQRIDPNRGYYMRSTGDAEVQQLKNGVSFAVTARVDGSILATVTLQVRKPYGSTVEKLDLLMDLSKEPPGANIFTRLHHIGASRNTLQTWTIDRLAHGPLKCNFDRLSRPLPSGRSVSMSFGNGPSSTSHAEGHRSFLVDVTLDESGRLPWPDPQEGRKKEFAQLHPS